MTGMGANTIQENDYVMAYAQFEDKDNAGNFSSFTCTVQYKSGGDAWSAP